MEETRWWKRKAERKNGGTIKAFKEADEHNGPAIIIAYCPCVEHGIKKGMEHSLDDAKLATTCGYFLTFRYNPDNEKFTLDSKDIDDTKYDEFLSNENRYKVSRGALYLRRR